MATCVRLCDSNENLNRTRGKEQKSITQIYTDWGNHYLDKIKSKRRIQHLPVDVTDGVVLADVIEAVTNQKLPDVNRKPRNASQMIDNISTCLRLLTALSIPLDDVTAADIHQGNLKSVLTVFFALSRYKQQQKQQQQQQQQEMAKIPVAKSNVTSIPVCAGKKQPQTTGSKIALPSSGHYGTPQLRPSLNSSTATSAASSRSASPSLCSTGSGNLTNGNSLIPRTPLQKTNGIKANSIKTPVAVHAPLNKQSMLDKLKFFKPIEKPQATLSKRPSSSSGFSSARSEQSDSSFASTNGNMSATPLTTLAVFDQPVKKSSPPAHVQITNGTKERSIRTRSKNSPKLSPKVKHRSGEVVEEARSESQQAAVIVPSVMANKPAFGGLGSGIPKPTAAVKGTAKIIKKPTVTTVTSTASNEDSTLERTPGDGKEVPVSKLTKLAPPSPVAKSFANPLSHLESIHDCQPKVASTRQCETPKMEVNASQGMVTSEDQPVADQQLLEPESVQLVANGVENCLVAEQPAEVPRMSSRSTLGGGGPVAKVSPMPTSNGPSNGPSEQLNDEEDVDEPMNVQPMSPLLNTSNLSLMKRNNNATACYASDNEAVTCSKSSSAGKRSLTNGGYSDPLDGYLSEGGASLYARKLHYLAVTQQQQQQQQRQRHKDDDSFDDCSSLSSGVSDPWNDVYGLHLKMEHSSVYPGYGTPLQNRRHPPAVVESSPYKQISSSQWKKFIEAGRLPSSERFQTDLWKAEVRDSSRSQQQSHEESPKRSSEHKKLNTAPADQQSSRRKVNGADGSDVRQQPQQQLQQQAAKGSPSFGYVKKSSGTSTSDSLKRHELTNGKSSLSYKTANVTAVPKLNDASAEAVPACYNRSLERPKTRLKVSGGTQTDMNNSPRSSKTTAKLPPSVKSVSQSAPPAQQPTQHYASFSDSEYHSVNGLKFQPANPTAGVAKGSPVASNLPASFKSYSLTAPIANQLSQNIRERIMLNGTQSLPKSHLAQLKAIEDKRLAHAHIAAHLFAGVGDLQNNTDTNNSMDLNLDSPANANTFNGAVDKLRDKEKSIKYVASGRPHPHPNHHTDGSLSDTPYTAYWNKYAHPAKNPNELLSDPESLDSVPMQAPKLLWLNNPPSPRLNRSNSVRSTKSEKLYPSMLQRNNEDNNGAELNYPVSNHHVLDGHANNADGARYSNSSPVANSGPAHSVSRSSLGNYSALLSLSRMASKEEDCHGSSLSLVSTASSLYSSQEEKQAAEIRKLRRELNEAQEKVNTLSGQLSTNAHVVSAFEQSLASMTSRLQSLTLTAEQKENELQDLRQFMDQLRKQGIEASMPTVRSEHHVTNNLSPAHRQLSTDSVSSLASQLTNLSSASSSSPPQAANGGAGSAQMAIPSASSPSPSPSLKKKSWLRNSFSKAFSRSKRGQSSSRGGSDTEDSGPVSTWSAPSSPLLASHHPHHPSIHSQSTHSSLDESASTPEMVDELKKQLREKDMVLTDIRLEALSSAHQLEALKETVSRMRNEMLSLKQDNERLQRHIEQVTQQNSTQSSAHNSTEHVNVQGLRASSVVDAPITTDVMLGLDIDKESKAIPVRIHIREYDDIILEDISEQTDHIWLLGYTGVSGKTRWDLLDASIRQLFAEYVRQIDPASHLGLDEDCLWYYRVGEVVRSLVTSDEGGDDDEFNAVPELLPCGYLVGDYNQIHVFIKTARKFSLPASLTLDTLVPLPILNRYLSLLHEHRRIVLSGPSGTGKSYLARKLAENCLVRQRGHRSSPNITTLKVDSAGCKEVRHLLAQISENLASGNTNDVPDVIILEDLHLASSLNDVLAPLSQLETSKVADGDDVRTPFVIGTTGPVIQQSTAQLQLQYNLRWILLANHTEPVQGLLSRFLRRRLIENELKSKTRDRELEKVVEWIPRCWAHLNRFLESHNSADVTIGPRWFLLVPADSTCSQVWFTDLWNYTLGPYLLHAAKEGLQLYGKRSPWEDPAQWVLSTYPWNQGSAYDALMRLRSEDVGYDTATRPRSLSTNNQANEQDRDPLFNMLIKLQEAAGLPSPTENSEQDDVSSESQNSCETKEEDC